MQDDDELPRLRKILRENVRALIEDARSTPSKSKVSTILAVAQHSQAIGGGLTNGTVGRMATGESPVNIDAIDDLAAAFGLQPWQLLVEKLNPKALPQLADAAFLLRLEELVHSASVAVDQKDAGVVDEPQVERTPRGRKAKGGPAFQAATAGMNGEKKNARRPTGKVQKPKGRGRG